MSGIVGIVSEDDCVDDLFYATDYHSHLGTEYGGLAVSDGERLVRRVHNTRKAQFKSRFFQDVEFQTFRGNKGIGVISDRDYQPLIAQLKFGEYAIATAGYIDNQKELADKLVSEGASFSEMRDRTFNQTELVSKLINKGKDIVDGINKMNERIEGSISLLLLGREGIYIARAKYGHTPLVLGKKSTGGRNSSIVAFENCSFKNLGFKTQRELGPNEIIFLEERGERVLQKPGSISQFCTFLYVYTGFPSSEYNNLGVADFRIKDGRRMGEKEEFDLDGVWGVQDSGVIYSFGFSSSCGVPVIPITFKYTPGWGRSYTPINQETRNLIAMMKQITADSLIKDKSLGVTEDSIVRGTQLMNYYFVKLWNAGAKGIHIRPACPALLWPCKYLFSTRTTDELFARKVLLNMFNRRLSDDEILPFLDVDSRQYKDMIQSMEKLMKGTSLKSAGLDGTDKEFSLRYQKLEDMVSVTGLPKESLCTYCWDGCKGACGG
jgi:amidophosphoribosyltransferase